MRKNSIQAKDHKKYKATTNSRCNLPAVRNIRNSDFTVDKSEQKIVSDITYILIAEKSMKQMTI